MTARTRQRPVKDFSETPAAPSPGGKELSLDPDHPPEPVPSAEKQLPLEILPQPDDTTCGPTCLHAVYRFYGSSLSLQQVAEQIPRLPTGGTLTSILARHALSQGFRATIHTYNLQVFDPTWFSLPPPEMARKLEARAQFKRGTKAAVAARNYLQFLNEGGQFRFEDLTTGLIRHYIEDRQIPVLTGLSATYLYQSPREYGPDNEFDDIRGEPSGHFVVLCGYNASTRDVLVADPLYPNPFAPTHHYLINIDRVLCAILLGILTYDANLLIIEPPNGAASPELPKAVP